MVARKGRPLSVVKPGAEPPKPAKKAAPKKRAPAKPRTLEHAAKLSRKTMLETLRARIAVAMEDPRAHPRDLANLTKQFLDVTEKLDALGAQSGRGKAPAAQSAVADTPNEAWDEGAI